MELSVFVVCVTWCVSWMQPYHGITKNTNNYVNYIASDPLLFGRKRSFGIRIRLVINAFDAEPKEAQELIFVS